VSVREGAHLPTGYVPETFLFAFVGSRIVGRVAIRHTLNAVLEREGGHIGYVVVPEFRRRGYATRMLSLALRLATAQLGIAEVLLVCGDSNVASIRVINETVVRFMMSFASMVVRSHFAVIGFACRHLHLFAIDAAANADLIARHLGYRASRNARLRGQVARMRFRRTAGRRCGDDQSTSSPPQRHPCRPAFAARLRYSPSTRTSATIAPPRTG
jgi:GNAT superfamily N-acetyltransferase